MDEILSHTVFLRSFSVLVCLDGNDFLQFMLLVLFSIVSFPPSMVAFQ